MNQDQGELVIREDKMIKTLIQKRGSIKARITKFNLFIDSIASLAQVPIVQIEVRLDKIKQCWEAFDDIQTQIEDKEGEGDQNERDIFEESYFEVIGRAEEIIKKYSTDSVSAEVSASYEHAYHPMSQLDIKLPTIKVPTFNGDIDAYPAFQELYTSIIHNNANLTDVQKFQYLKSSLQGEAGELISSLPLSQRNYSVALSLLNDRYNRRGVLIMKHIRKLFNLDKIERETSSALHKLHDDSQKHIRALKALNQPTEQWDLILVHIISSRLDSKSYREWQASINNLTDDLPTLAQLTEFINKKCNILDAISLTQTSSKPNVVSTSTRTTQGYQSKPSQAHSYSRRFSTNQQSNSVNSTVPNRSQVSCLATSDQPAKDKSETKCYKCRGLHEFFRCPDFQKMSLSQREECVKSLNLCFNCLRRGHISKDCRSSRCRTCGRLHNSLLHNNNNRPQNDQTNATSVNVASVDQEPVSSLVAFQGRSNASSIILSTVLIKVRGRGGYHFTARALLDCGSQTSFITENLAQKLGLLKQRVSLPIVGISDASTRSSFKITTAIKSLHSEYEANITLFILPKITNLLPAESVSLSTISLPKVKLADPYFNEPGKIDILMGADLFWQILCTGVMNLSNTQIQLRETHFGWIVTGQTACVPSEEPNDQDKTICCLAQTDDNLDKQLRRFWEIEECEIQVSPEEKHCEEFFSATTRRINEQRYCVKMPFKEHPSNLGDSRSIALKRFELLERRLARNLDLRQEYCNFIEQYKELGHMIKLSPSEIESLDSRSKYFLPHHPIIKESSSTTRVRVVFDASAKTSSGLSLNDILFAGPEIQDDVFALVTRFRQHNVVMSADIEKMFRQIEIEESHTWFLLVFWRASPELPLEIYRLKTVTYGTACAPFLAKRTLKQLALDEGEHHEQTSKIIEQDFFMDDLLTGCESLEQAIFLQRDIATLLNKGGFQLRKWKSNSPELLEIIDPALLDNINNPSSFSIDQDPKFKTLGLSWQTNSDTFRFLVKIDQHTVVTKRKILSSIAKLFDPLGLLGPLIVKAKIFLQQLWAHSLQWDQEIQDPILTDWINFYQSFEHINTLSIPRQITCLSRIIHAEMHGFSDASEKAYGACVYLRSVNEIGEITVRLIASKSRVAPLKCQSIPRLELCGALLLANRFPP